MESLPNEMLQLIMSYLTLPKDMLRFALASKQIYAVSDYDLFCRLQAMLPIHRYMWTSVEYTIALPTMSFLISSKKIITYEYESSKRQLYIYHVNGGNIKYSIISESKLNRQILICNNLLYNR